MINTLLLSLIAGLLLVMAASAFAEEGAYGLGAAIVLAVIAGGYVWFAVAELRGKRRDQKGFEVIE